MLVITIQIPALPTPQAGFAGMTYEIVSALMVVSYTKTRFEPHEDPETSSG
ncbi:hypothetical protein [Balneola sp. EhC07]|uniref:hypothetical protein n=1 Tax=Balneola sp. EhC07 TaxID=1849360 RepID=UPI001F33FD82|nr:hypothetical protein [Balneola sp. EhC07]